MRRVGRIAAVLCVCAFPAAAQDTTLTVSERIAVTGGLSVAYASIPDVVDMVNATPGLAERVSPYKAGAVFLGSVTFPLGRLWAVKAQYGYLLESWSVRASLGTGVAEYTVTAHLPTILAQYTLASERYYAVKVGLGAGYHVGSLKVSFFTQQGTYTDTGIGFVLELEGDTAIGDHLFAVLSAAARWEAMGALTNAAGVSAGGIIASPTLHLFAPSAGIGLAYVF